MTRYQKYTAKEAIKVLKKNGITSRDIVNLFNQYPISSAKEAKDIGLKVKFLASGSFRTAYLVNGKLVAKFPTGSESYCVDNWGHTAIEHSANEVESINSILKTKKFKPLHRYMLDILHHNKETGVILTHRYDRVGSSSLGSAIVGMINYLARDLGLYCNDLHDYNVGIDDCGYVKILDLGLGTS